MPIQNLRYKCFVCGKLTAGRSCHDRSTGEASDGSERFPRRHKGPDGKPCPGNIEFALWVDVDTGATVWTPKDLRGKEP